MQDDRAGTGSGETPTGQTAVSPNNPCPFLRGLVAADFVDGHVVPLPLLVGTIEAASGEKGLKKTLVGLKTYPVALIANGLNPLRLLRSWWSGAVLDQLRDGPLDKHGVGSRILDATAHVNETELARLAEFGKDRPDPAGGIERGLTSPEITAYMNANFERAKGHRRWFDRRLMMGEWPVLLDFMGKGEGENRYLSVAEVSTLFVERRLPARIVARLKAQPVSATAGVAAVLGKLALVAVAFVLVALALIIEFPDKTGFLPQLIAQILPPPLPTLPPTKEAHWLDQNWSTEDRHWFHHASQGTATFPVRYDWFIALEQPGIHFFTEPSLMKDSRYLERFGFLPSPKSIHTDEATLQRFGYYASDAKTEPAPASVAGLKPTPAENFDGLPVGFARMPGAPDPTTGKPGPDMIGLTCAACHTGHINYQGVSLRFDGGPGMVDLRKLELATGLSIGYTLKVPGRFRRFATRVLGPDATKAERDDLEQKLAPIGKFLLDQKNLYDKTIASKKTYDNKQQQMDTEEGFGRLDALNRIGNQVFTTDMAMSGLQGFEKNLHAQDAPVSFPPIWTVPWLLWAQYDASIEQPLIRNAGEGLGVAALLNLSPDAARDTLFRSSVALENLVRIEKMLRGPDPFSQDPKSQDPKAFGGLNPPKWPSQIFSNYPAWKIDPARVVKGRAIYAAICIECHRGPVDDPVFDTQFPEQSVWKQDHWDATMGPALMPVQKPVDDMGTDSAQAEVLGFRRISVPGFLDMQPARDMQPGPGQVSECKNMPLPSTYSSTEMPYSIALMTAVELVSRKWMNDNHVSEADQKEIWGPRKNCPNPETDLHYRARPLNGVWATAPYLHNGSVPSLWWMLTPAAERPKQFCMGFRDFDPEQVGFRVEAHELPKCKDGETLFSVTDAGGKALHGNSNLGHSLEAPPNESPHEHKKGVIGRLLSDEERKDLIEYLKTL
jgi:mono/diheme cytochrome c family protein